MSNPGRFGALEYEAESSWGENVTTFATYRPRLVAPLQLNLTHDKIATEEVVQRRQEGGDYFLGGIGGSFTMTIDLPGHGATTSGSPTIDANETFLGLVFGNAALSASASTTADGTGDEDGVGVAAATGFTAGSLCVIGELGDGEGEGQFYPISTHASSVINLLAGVATTPVSGAVIYPVTCIYPSASPTSTAITGTRFRYLTGNIQYAMHGCFPQSVSFTGLEPGGRPQLAITWGVSWWQYQNATFPSTVSSNEYNPSVVAAGSLHVNTPGTTTRATRKFRSFAINYTIGVQPLMGPGGINQYQTIVGAVRTGDMIEVRWTEDADATTTTPVLPGFATGTNKKLIMYTASTVIGKRIGILLRNVCVKQVPVQTVVDGINRLEFVGEAYNGATTTSDLTLAAFVLGFA